MEHSTEEGDSPVVEVEREGEDPEYHRTRVIRWEDGGPTPQG